jgi:hypothetical protein
LNALDLVCDQDNVQPAEENHMMNDHKDQEELKIQCKSPVPADDSMAHIQFMREGWELEGDPEGLDTEQDEIPASFLAEQFFT